MKIFTSNTSKSLYEEIKIYPKQTKLRKENVNFKLTSKIGLNLDSW